MYISCDDNEVEFSERAYKQGCDAYDAGNPASSNPYPYTTLYGPYDYWKSGYTDRKADKEYEREYENRLGPQY